MQKAKWFIFGVLATLVVSGTALAASPVIRELTFGVNVTLDGELITFDDDMQPFIMDNRTFLPVRAIAEIMGLDVGFDGATNTVALKSMSYETSYSMQLDALIRGSWIGDQYINESLGLRFELPQDWIAMGQIDIDEVFREAIEAVWDIAESADTPIMMAFDPNTDTSVLLTITQARGWTAQEYIDFAVEGFELIGGSANVGAAVIIGENEWYSYSSQFMAYARHLVNVDNGSLRVITITIYDEDDSVYEILAAFSGL